MVHVAMYLERDQVEPIVVLQCGNDLYFLYKHVINAWILLERKGKEEIKLSIQCSFSFDRDGNYPYSFKYLFLRVYGKIYQSSHFILSGVFITSTIVRISFAINGHYQ